MQNGLKMEPKMFVPGPVNTSESVKAAMLKDIGCRDSVFVAATKYVRTKLIELADPRKTDKYDVVLLAGTGSYGAEAVLGTVLGNKNDKKVLLILNGFFGERLAQICQQADYDHVVLRYKENDFVDLHQIEDHLKKHGSEYSLVSFVHCETSVGVVNPLTEIVQLIKRYSNALIFVDAMSTFGAYPLDLDAEGVDFLVASVNKCLESFPGMCYVFCRTEAVNACEGRSVSWILDLVKHVKWQNTFNTFRTTGPTVSVLALQQALKEYEAEGGLEARRARYMKNSQIVKKGMKRLGFKQFTDESRHDGCIVTSFEYLNDPHFNFQTFFQKLYDRNCILNPSKFYDTPTFRIGHIGQIFEKDCERLIEEVEKVLIEMDVKVDRQFG